MSNDGGRKSNDEWGEGRFEEVPLETGGRSGMIVPMRFSNRATGLAGLVLAGWTGVSVVHAAPVTLANPSFELPSTGFVDTRVDGWNKTPAPVWFDPATTGGVTWDQISGVFSNPPVGQPTRKTNIDGSQALYLFALPTAGLTQDLAATYEAGVSYELTVGVAGGGGGMPEGTTLVLGFYYLDGVNPVSLGATVVSHSAAAFPTTTTFVDYSAVLPAALGGEAWVGKSIGVQIISANATGVGYWDLDHVRLEATVVPEPGTWALMGTGVGLLALTGWRRAARR